MKFTARVCKVCKKPMGTLSFRYKAEDGSWTRDYFHPKCFKKFVGNLKEVK